jgi:hypothetical protein
LLGYYENFPSNIHFVESFTSCFSSKQLQQRLVHVFCALNHREFFFEEVAYPTIPQGKIIFEFGLAEDIGYNLIDKQEVKRTLELLARERLRTLDFFCVIRYYKNTGNKKSALKFDYYMFRTLYSKDNLEIQVFHERGPRYLLPEDLTSFIFSKLNEESTRKILKIK